MGKKKEMLFLSLFSVCLVLRAQEPPNKYVVYKAMADLKIDGKAEEVSWQKAPWSANFIDIEGVEAPKYGTRMKMLWDDRYLYFFAEMEEPHIWATLKQRDTVIFFNNDFEIFIDPNGDTHDYMEFEMNALNTVWDLWLTKPYRNHPEVIDGWDIHGLKTAVAINGTLNDPGDIDKGWSVEIAMPWEALLEASEKNEVPVNEFWRINFSRVNWSFDLIDGRYSRKKGATGKYLPENNWVWSPQGVINMHEPEHWGYVFFASEEVGENVDFEIPKDAYITRYLYEIARKIWKVDTLSNTEDEMDFQKLIKPVEILGKWVAPEYEQHRFGWNIWTRSPFTGKVIELREDGKSKWLD